MTDKERLERAARTCAGLAALFGIVGYVVEVRALSFLALCFAAGWITARIITGINAVKEMEK
jgi:hypothetical protein